MAEIFLLNHAETTLESNKLIEEWTLSPVGIKHAEELGSRLIEFGIARIIASKEPKALQTAKIIAKNLSIEDVEIYDGIEELHRNLPEIVPIDTFKDMVKQTFHRANESVNGWESASTAQQRIVEALRQIGEDDPDKKVLIVSHSLVTKLAELSIRGNKISYPDDDRELWNGAGRFLQIDTRSWSISQDWQ
jgi:broad specificity phosphatase PhoE